MRMVWRQWFTTSQYLIYAPEKPHRSRIKLGKGSPPPSPLLPFLIIIIITTATTTTTTAAATIGYLSSSEVRMVVMTCST